MTGDESADTAARDVSRRNLLAMASAAGAGGIAGCTGPTCELVVTDKTTTGTFEYGDQGTYEITVCNDSYFFSCYDPITIEDDLPDGMTLNSVGGNWTASSSLGVVTATNSSYGSLGGGSCLTLELTVDVAPAGAFPTTPPVENCVSGEHRGDPIGVTFAGSDDFSGCISHQIAGQTATPTGTETPTPTEEPTASPTGTDEPRPTETPTPTDQMNPTVTETPTPTDEPTASPTPTPTPTGNETETRPDPDA